MINLKGKTVVVTGGTRGIGAACSRMFSAAGANVVMSYLGNHDAAGRLVAEITATGGTCLAVPGNLVHEEEAFALIDQAVEAYGRVDVLVNNHGIWTGEGIDTMPVEVWDETIAVNLRAVFLVTKRAVQVMKEQGSGTIINVSSTAGQRGEAFHSNYASSKGALIAFTKSLSSELAPLGITCNCVAPGWVDTEMCTETFSDAVVKEQIRQGIPIGRIPGPEDIAGPIVFLASDLARHISGEILNVNGGAVLCG